LLKPATLLWWPVGVAGFGIVLVLIWVVTGVVGGAPTGALGLGGACAFYLGTGQALAELRTREEGVPTRGILTILLCGALFAAGLLVCLELHVNGIYGVLAALLVGPIGLTLLSEDVQKLRPWGLWRGALLGGVPLVLAGGFLLVQWPDLAPSFAWPLVVVVGALVLMISSSTQAMCSWWQAPWRSSSPPLRSPTSRRSSSA
jgi:hypothetical protein